MDTESRSYEMTKEEFDELLHLRAEVEYLRSRKHHVEWLVDELNELAKRLPRIAATLAMYQIPVSREEVSINQPCTHEDFYNPARELNIRRLPINFAGGYQQDYKMCFPGLLSGLFEYAKNYLVWKFDENGKVKFSIGYY